MSDENAYLEKVLQKLKREKDYYCIPVDFKNNEKVISLERKLGMREFGRRGYDIIKDCFFVEESIINKKNGDIIETFNNFLKNFELYYKFLEGDIYTNSCYYQYSFSEDEIRKYRIDQTKLNMDALIDYTIENYEKENEHELEEENKALKKQDNYKILYAKLEKCSNYKEFTKILKKYREKNEHEYELEDVAIYNLIKLNRNKMFKILMESINNEESICDIKKMCLYFSFDEVLNKLNYNGSPCTKQTKDRRIKKIKKIQNEHMNHNYIFSRSCNYEKSIGLYKVYERYEYTDIFCAIVIEKYFHDINELIEYSDGDLSNYNLSMAPISIKEIEKCKTNEKTILPIDYNKLKTEVLKIYNNEKFYVRIRKIDDKNNIIFNKVESFKYFFDFRHYLNNDLSEADLLFCDGFSNLRYIDGLNLKNIHLRSSCMDKLGLKYDIYEKNKEISFSETLENENATQMVLFERKNDLAGYNDWLSDERRISYVSDIHLLHRLKDCKSDDDVEYTIKSIVNKIFENCGRILLIGGDISSSFNIYKRFIDILSKKALSTRTKVFIILGNHELWEFENEKLESIIEEYRKYIESRGLFLLQNDLVYIENEVVNRMFEKDINKLTSKDINEKTLRSNIVIVGGIGFSQYNREFNANNGIYRNVINRKKEIEESEKWDKIYSKLKQSIYDKNVIVLSHMQKEDWSNDNELVKRWVYVSGHTHRNYFFDDGEYRIYSDNQLGYNYTTAFSKSFLIDYRYDIFKDYKDGIYEITGEEYCDFYRGKNIQMDYNREGTIYMLKKKGYYCFLKKSKEGLCILNGGALKSVDNKSIEYYFNNMDSQIEILRKPLDEYTKYQKGIAEYIKAIGGIGKIHGCIVDISYFSHIYVNPFNGFLTGYYAYNIIDKFVYKNIPSLLKAQNPEIYNNYRKSLEDKNSKALIIRGNEELVLVPTAYEYTDIYTASREIKKMQKLESGILAVWNKESDTSILAKNEMKYLNE